MADGRSGWALASVTGKRAVVALLLLVVAGLNLFVPGSALAHAYLVHADPPPGSTLAQAPTQLRLTFSEQVDPSFSLHYSPGRSSSVRCSRAVTAPRAPSQCTRQGGWSCWAPWRWLPARCTPHWHRRLPPVDYHCGASSVARSTTC